MALNAERDPEGVSAGVAMTRKSSRVSVPAKLRVAVPTAPEPVMLGVGKELFVTTPQALLFPMSL